MNKSIDTLEDAGVTSEREAFTCSGCGRDTVVHIGIRTMLTEKRCVRCQGTTRHVPVPTQQTGRVGTHGGKRIADEALRLRRKAKSLRASRSRTGEPKRKSCASYGCSHRKHGAPKAGR